MRCGRQRAGAGAPRSAAREPRARPSQEHYKRTQCDCAGGGRCPAAEAGAPVWCCALWHDAGDRAAAAAAAKKLAPGADVAAVPIGDSAAAAAAAPANGAAAAASGSQAGAPSSSAAATPASAAPAAAAAAPAEPGAAGAAAAGEGAAAAAAGAPTQEVLRFLYFGPEDGSVGVLDWYYLDPEGNTYVSGGDLGRSNGDLA